MMRLRKFELAFVAITLAFIFFIGGFFTGRNFGNVSIDSFDSLQVATSSGSDAITANAQSLPNGTDNRTSGSEASVSDMGASTGIGVDVDTSSGTGADNATAENVMTNPDINSNQENAAPTDVPPGAPRGGDGRININTASKNELMDLPGIGPSLADSIIEYRNSNGAFLSIEDIMNVSGIAEGRFARIKDRITV